MKIKILTIFTILMFVLALLTFQNKFTVLAVDVYGNNITYVEVWEDTTLKANFTASGGEVRLNTSKQIMFIVGIKFNSTLATSTAEAIDYTKVLMNVTGVWSNYELTNVDAVLIGDFYYLKEQGVLTAGSLEVGQTYACSILYQGYY